MAKGADPVQAARAVATYSPADPAVWIERAGMAGIQVSLVGDRLCLDWTAAADHDEVTFFNCWLNLTPGGSDAVLKLLSGRQSA